MQLRDHPKLKSQWRESWGGSFSGDDKFAGGEEPDRLLSVEESESKETITLKAEYQGSEVSRKMLIEDSEFRSRLVEVLRQNIGKSIKEIGSLDIRF